MLIPHTQQTLELLTQLYGPDLADAQLRLEHEGYQSGADAVNNAISRRTAGGAFGDTAVARPLIASLVNTLVDKLQSDIMKATGKGQPSKAARALSLVKQYTTHEGLNRIAYIAIRGLVNRVSKSDNATIQDVSMAIGREIEDECRYGRIRDLDAAYWRNHEELAIKKRPGLVYRKSVAAARERVLLSSDDLTTWDAWNAEIRFALGSQMISYLVEMGVCEMRCVFERRPRMLKPIKRNLVSLTQEATQWLHQRQDFLLTTTPHFMPMLVPPKPWVSLNSGGYWGYGQSNPGFVKIRSKRTLNRYTDVDLTRCFSAVNAIQETPWVINGAVLDVLREIMTWPSPGACGIEPPSMQPLPPKPVHRITGEPLPDEAPEWKQWRKDAHRIYQQERSRVSRRLRTESALRVAERFADAERLWFPFNCDFRGRMYAIPSFSPQGTDLDKGLLLLADALPMGDTGEYYLRQQLANTYGHDKEPLDFRQKWTHDAEPMIVDCGTNPLDFREWMNADSPFQFLAACIEYVRWKNAPVPRDYRCGLPIAFDGSCSGIQHFSAMLRDEVGATAVNLVPGDKPADIYRVVADAVSARVEHDLLHGTENTNEIRTDESTGEIRESVRWGTKQLAQAWLQYGITRSVTKRCVMTLPYGSKQYGFTDQLISDIVNPYTARHGDALFGNPRVAAGYMSRHIWESLSTIVVAAVEGMRWLRQVASVCNAENVPVHWVSPTGFPVWQEYRESSMQIIKTVLAGSIKVHSSVQRDETVDVVNPLSRHEQMNGIAPNFVHSLDAAHMMLTVEACESRGIRHFACVHDSFGTCPGGAHVLAGVVRETFVDMYTQNDVLQSFADAVSSTLTTETVPDIPQKGTLDLSVVRNSLYCFC